MPQVVPASAPPMLPMVPPPVAAAPATPKLPPVAAAPAAPVLQPKLPTVPPPTTPTPPLTQVPPTVAPAPKTPVAVVPTAAPIAKQYVVLKDDKLIEGTVKIDGEKVIVKQGALDRPYAKGDIQFIGRSKDEVYRFVVGKVPPNDPAARLKVARWCMFNGMRTHALIEAREVLRLDPKNAAATQLARVLEESLVKFPEDGAPAASTAPNIPVSNPTGPSLPPVPPPIPPAANPPVAADEPEADIPQELAALFPTRIQPILVNQCADCHAKPGHASGFVLAKGTDFDPNPALAKPNLAAVLKQLHKADPAKSPLLVKSLTAHGGMQQPAFVNRNIPGYRILEAWTYAVSGTPTSPAPASEPAVKSNPLPPSATPPAAKAPVASATGSDKPSPLPPPDVGAFGQEAKPLPAGPDPANTGEPADEFDPSVYNRNAHPGRK